MLVVIYAQQPLLLQQKDAKYIDLFLYQNRYIGYKDAGPFHATDLRILSQLTPLRHHVARYLWTAQF